MASYVLTGLLVIFSLSKFYKHRQLFKQLSKKEWLQYLVGFLSAWIIAATIIIGGSKLLSTMQVGKFSTVFSIVLILLALVCAGFIMKRTLPEKLKTFYT